MSAASEEIKKIEEAKERWMGERKVGDIPHGCRFEGDPLEVLYTPVETRDIDYLSDIGFPGEFPFTRGPYPGMYRKRPWLMNQYSGFGSAEDTNQRWKMLLSHGQWSVNLAFDLPSHLGLDSDNPLAEDEVGRLGVAIDSLADFEILFDGINLAAVPASFNTVGIAPMVLAMLVATGEHQGVSPAQIMGVTTNDILSVYVARGTWILPPEPSIRLITDMIEYCCRNMPRFFPINIQPVYFREIGATLSQEAGYGIAMAMTYIEKALARGLAIDEFAPRLSMHIGASYRFLEEAAKFRAARKVWARLLRDRYGATSRDSLALRITGATGGSGFTREEPEMNMVRGAFGAVACILGGVQGLLVAGYDEAYAIPTEKASRLGLRTQQIIFEESGVSETVDPLGGSWFVEAMTKKLEGEIWSHIEDIEAHGGAVEAVESGYMRRCMDTNILRWHREQECGERVMVGVNKYRSEEEEVADFEIHQADPKAVKRQLARLRKVKKERDAGKVRQALDDLRRAALGGENTIPFFIAAVKAYATVGEMMDILRQEYGEWVEPAV